MPSSSSAKMKILSRSDFKAQVFNRDKHKCVFCGDPAEDAHHILDRKLFTDGGYYLNNGASVCNRCHLLCEDNTYSVELVREKCGIKEIVLPVDFSDEYQYDKWGNILLEDGRKIWGPLFDDTAVQKLLKRDLHMYEHRYKYNHTPHLPQSRSRTDDDHVLTTTAHLHGLEVVITEKMDGESFSGYIDGCHARSLDSRHHSSRDWVKAFWSERQHLIPDKWRVCGENLYAQHSIRYDALPSYFMGFSVWDDRNYALSWDDTLTWFELLGIVPVPVLYRGIYSDAVVAEIIKSLDTKKQEGFVVRTVGEFAYSDFGKNVAKWVRKGHVQPGGEHWMHGVITPNGLAS